MWRAELALILLLAGAEAGPVKGLHSGDPMEQIRALEEVEKGAIPGHEKSLISLAVKGVVWPVRHGAVRALRRVGPPDTARLLASHAAIQTTEATALEALGLFGGPEAVTELSAFCRKGRGDTTRVRAAEALAATGLPEALPILQELASARDPMVRGAALRSLGWLGRAEAAAFLLSTAASLETQDLRIRAGVALRRLKQTAAGMDFDADPERLMRQLEVLSVARAGLSPEQLYPLLAHKDLRVRAWAVFVVARSENAGETALAASKTEGDETLERNLVLLLPRLEPDVANILLHRLAKSPHRRVRLEAFVILAGSKSDLTPAEGELLTSALMDPSWDVSVVAALALARRRQPNLAPLLDPLITHADWRRRAGAYYAMAFIRDPKVIDILGRGLADADGMTVRLARRILATVTGRTFKSDTDFLLWRTGEGQQFAFTGSRRSLARYEPCELGDETYRAMATSEILVKVGDDRLDTVFSSLGFRITDVTRESLDAVDLNPEQVLVLTCPTVLTPLEIERVDWFVTLGGSLVMTDEALGRKGRQPVAGYVSIHSEVTLKGHTLHPAEAPDPDHSLLRDVFTREGRTDGSLLVCPRAPRLLHAPWDQWGSFMITVDDPFRTEILADSLEMRQTLGASPLACAWHHGLGRALHFVSHFGHQMGQVRALLEAREPEDRLRAVVDELGYPLESALGWAQAGKLEGTSGNFLRGSFPLFSLMGNFIREQRTFLEAGSVQGRSR